MKKNRLLSALRLAIYVSAAVVMAASVRGQVPRSSAPVTPTNGCGQGTSNPNIPSLEVHVTTSDGQPMKSDQIRVQLASESGIPVAQAFTNARGSVALFYGLSVCSFTLKVSGPGIEATTTRVIQLLNSSTTNVEFVTVKLTSENSGSPATPPPPPAIPEEARREFTAGNEAYAKGDVIKAQEAFEKAVAIYPKYVNAHNNLGVLYLRQNEKVKAREEFLTVVKLDTGFAPAHVNLARVLLSEQKLPEAETELNRPVALDPNALNAMVLLSSTAYANKEYEKALAYARKVHSMPQHEQYADVHLVAGQILHGQNKDQEAIAEFELFLKESPNDQRLPQVKELIVRLQGSARTP